MKKTMTLHRRERCVRSKMPSQTVQHILHRALQFMILLTFALIPLWYRFPENPFYLPTLYVSRFSILQVMLLAIVLWIARGIPGLRCVWRDPLQRTWLLLLLTLTAWVIASQMWAFRRAANPEVAQSAAFQFSVVMLFAIVVISTRPSPKWVIGALLTGVVWNTALAILQTHNQADLGLRFFAAFPGEFPLDPARSGVSVVVANGVRWLRPYALLPHPNMLGGFLMIGLLAAVGWILSANQKLRWFGTAIFGFGLWGLLLTFSRGAWLAFAVGGFAIVPILWRTHKRRLLRPLGVAGGIAIVVGLLFTFTHRDLLLVRTSSGSNTELSELRSYVDRTIFTNYAQRAIRENPVRGVGIGNFPWRASFYLVESDFDLRGDNAHHVLLQAWAELGVIGWGLTVAAWMVGIELALRNRPDAQRAALLAGVLALGIIGIIDHYPWTILQFQTAWWGLLAVAGSDDKANRNAITMSQA